jgi:hypothetical protein
MTFTPFANEIKDLPLCFNIARNTNPSLNEDNAQEQQCGTTETKSKKLAVYLLK